MASMIKTDFTVVIPARFNSARLPGKPLAMIAGKPMIQRVYERAQLSQAAHVVVATDDQRIADTVIAFGGEVCLTSPDHRSGTDRIQEVASLLELGDEAIVVNVQGDEPLIPGEVIDQVADNLDSNPQAVAATLSEPINTYDDFVNPNIVKVVSDQSQLALYFSRAPIPYPRDDIASGHGLPKTQILPVKAQRHIGIYAYRVSLLNQFVCWSPAAIELVESLEQLRIMAQGQRIHVAPACADVPAGIDTPEDLSRINQQLTQG